MSRISVILLMLTYCRGSQVQNDTLGDGPGFSRPSTYRVLYLDWRLNWSDMTKDLGATLDMGFNVIILGFYLTKPADADLQWTMLTDDQRKGALKMIHSRGAKLMVSSGGATFPFESHVKKGVGDAQSYCTEASQWAIEYGFDGIDFDMELAPGNSKPLADGSAVDWLVACTKASRTILGTNRLISHAPQAPYFGSWAGPNFGYTSVYKQAPTIDFFNIQYYNQGSTSYLSYEDIFIKNKQFWNTAVLEINRNGVPLHKLVVGKPAGQGYASNGWVSGSNLHKFGNQACNDFGWNAGFMGWMYAPQDPSVKDFGKGISKELCTGSETRKNTSRLLRMVSSN